MRFAVVATAIAALAALPLAGAVSGPQMAPEEFLSRVRCAAEPGAAAELGRLRTRLNWEAVDQSSETVAQARRIVREAGSADRGVVGDASAAACSETEAAGRAARSEEGAA